jgi:UDP-2,3-diacylglucosamine hydrolase
MNPGWPTLQAPPRWRVIDFISDLHLQAGEPATVLAWQHYMANGSADAVFILGDLFEVWVGDDAAQAGSFEAQCAQTLQAASRRQDIFFMPGNRDFLVGPAFMDQCGATLLADPTVLAFDGQRWLLTHGDALCIADTDYMAFRATVRSAAWQTAFLSQPLTERKTVARGLRQQSAARKQASQLTGASYADVDSALALAWLDEAQSHHMIHGHTHKPADHVLGPKLQRTVLSDWDLDATPARAEVLRLSCDVGRPATRGQLQRLAPRLA